MESSAKFGTRLLTLRVERNETQAQLAEAIGITRQSLSRYETNERTPNIDLVYNIAKHYGVSTDYLLGLSDYINNEEKSELEQEIENKIHPLAIGIYRKLNECMEKMQKLSGYAYNKQEYLDTGFKFNDLMFSYLMNVIYMYDEIAEQANSVENTRPYISEVMEAYTKHTLSLKEYENKTIQLIANCIINGNIQK